MYISKHYLRINERTNFDTSFYIRISDVMNQIDEMFRLVYVKLSSFMSGLHEFTQEIISKYILSLEDTF